MTGISNRVNLRQEGTVMASNEIPLNREPLLGVLTDNKGRHGLVATVLNQVLEAQVTEQCIKVRKYKLANQEVVSFLRTQGLRDQGLEVKLSGPTQFPNDILRTVTLASEDLFSPAAAYRAARAILCKLTEAYYGQLDLCGETIRMQRLSNLYKSVDALREKYGQHTVFLGNSVLLSEDVTTTLVPD